MEAAAAVNSMPSERGDELRAREFSLTLLVNQEKKVLERYSSLSFVIHMFKCVLAPVRLPIVDAGRLKSQRSHYHLKLIRVKKFRAFLTRCHWHLKEAKCFAVFCVHDNIMV